MTSSPELTSAGGLYAMGDTISDAQYVICPSVFPNVKRRSRLICVAKEEENVAQDSSPSVGAANNAPLHLLADTRVCKEFQEPSSSVSHAPVQHPQPQPVEDAASIHRAIDHVHGSKGGPEPNPKAGFSENKESEAAAAHRCQNRSWTFWSNDPSAKSKKEAYNPQPIRSFSTLLDLSHFTKGHQLGSLTEGSNFYCFKTHIEPKVKDPACCNGGQWTITMRRDQLDKCWVNTVNDMVNAKYGEDVCGAVVKIRRNHGSISVWTKNAANEPYVLNLGKQLKRHTVPGMSMGFMAHDDARRLGQKAKNRYTM